MLAKDRNKEQSVLSFLTTGLVFQVNVHPETATVRKDNALPDSLTTADRAQRANAPLEILRHVLRVNMNLDHPVISSPALPVVTTMTFNPAPMHIWAPKAASMPLAIKPKVAVSANLIPHAPAST